MKRIRILILLTFACVVVIAGVVLSQSGRDPRSSTRFSGNLCVEHGIADSLCTRCHPELVSMFKARGDWCTEHKLPESQCYLCHPELAKSSGISIIRDGHDQHGYDHGSHDHSAHECDHGAFAAEVADASVDWCSTHRVPESQCTRCHPELVAAFKSSGDWCAGHGVPESHCYHCNPQIRFPQEVEFIRLTRSQMEMATGKPKTSLYLPNASHCATVDKIIQLASVETAGRAGLVIETVEAMNGPETIEAMAEIEFDARSTYAVTSLVSGTLVRWVVQPGEFVNRGQILAFLESIEGVSLKSDYAHAAALYTLAQKAYEREQNLVASGMSSLRDFQQAEAEYLRAVADLKKGAAALKAIGFTEAELSRIADEDADSEIPLRAGKSGVLVEQRIELGTVLTAGTTIGLISDTREMWAEVKVRERDLPLVQVGQAATLSADGQGWQRTRGVVTWVADAVDDLTRMGRVRISIEKNGERLRAHQFVTARIEVGGADNVVRLPADAVQWEGCCNIVFVAETRDRFRPRKVSVKYSDGQIYAANGVNPGERIVTHGSYLLKTELMKGNLGAGCSGHGA